MANDRFRLENMLIRSYQHFRSFKLSASFKAIDDLHFEGMPDNYTIYATNRTQGSQYLMNVFDYDSRKHDTYCVDVDNSIAKRLELAIEDMTDCLVEGEYLLVLRYRQSMAIFRDLIEIGHIKLDVKHEVDKNCDLIRGRYAQQVGQTMYAVDKYGCLCRVEWQDVKDGKYCKTPVRWNVKIFYVDRRLGLATVNTNNSLYLSTGTNVDLGQKVEYYATWTIVTSIAKYWIVSGDLHSQAVIACINKKGEVRSKIELKKTSNGYVNREGREYENHDSSIDSEQNEYASIDSEDNDYAGIYSLHEAYVGGRRGIMMAIERDAAAI